MMGNTIPANFLAPKATPLDYPMNLGFNQPPAVMPAVPMAQQQATVFQPQQGEDLHSVRGMDGAKRFQTKPNSRYAMFDEDDDVFYIKVTDQNNYPVSLKRYRFTEEEEPEPEVPQYVTMSEFTKFKEELLDGIKHLRAESGTAAAPVQSAQSGSKQPGK